MRDSVHNLDFFADGMELLAHFLVCLSLESLASAILIFEAVLVIVIFLTVAVTIFFLFFSQLRISVHTV